MEQCLNKHCRGCRRCMGQALSAGVRGDTLQIRGAPSHCLVKSQSARGEPAAQPARCHWLAPKRRQLSSRSMMGMRKPCRCFGASAQLARPPQGRLTTQKPSAARLFVLCTVQRTRGFGAFSGFRLLFREASAVVGRPRLVWSAQEVPPAQSPSRAWRWPRAHWPLMRRAPLGEDRAWKASLLARRRDNPSCPLLAQLEPGAGPSCRPSMRLPACVRHGRALRFACPARSYR